MQVKKILEWDTEFWKRKIGFADESDYLDWADSNGVECMFIELPVSDTIALGEVTKRGGKLLDVRVTLSSPPEAKYGAQQSLERSRARMSEKSKLADIARSAYRGQTRFYRDGNFLFKADAFYEHWLRESMNGWASVVLVAREFSEPVGFVTVHGNVNTETASVGLIAVDESRRGRGYGAMLMESFKAWALLNDFRRVTVTTQASNVQAQRVFQNCGFRTESVDAVLHHWIDSRPTPKGPNPMRPF